MTENFLHTRFSLIDEKKKVFTGRRRKHNSRHCYCISLEKKKTAKRDVRAKLQQIKEAVLLTKTYFKRCTHYYNLRYNCTIAKQIRAKNKEKSKKNAGLKLVETSKASLFKSRSRNASGCGRPNAEAGRRANYTEAPRACVHEKKKQ